MRLQAIRLHPFGRFAAESRDLAKPLVVIHGPNELGKTTLRQAIFHVLFTPTNLTPTQLKESVQPWLPQPGGDHAQVTLTFEHGGSTWTLAKRWGAGHSSLLSNGTTAVADPHKVQSQLGAILGHSEATFRHVLFTGQAELEHTLDAVDENAADLRDIRDLLKAGAGAAADVDEQRLRRELEDRIKKAFGRWDDQRDRPERQAGQERGLGNRWMNGVGGILKAWYAWQELVAEHDEVLELERDLDQINRKVAEEEQHISDAAAFLQKYGHLRNDVNERSLLDERQSRLEGEAASLGEAFRGWPGAEAAIKEWARRKSELENTRDKRQDELRNAQARQAGAAARRAFTAIKAAKEAWEQAAAVAQGIPAVGKDRLDAIERLHTAITAAETKLAARKLAWRIEAETPGELRIERGVEPAETLRGPIGTAGSAEARVRVVAGGLTLTVESGGDDVDALFESLTADRRRLAEELAACHAATPADARLMAGKRRDAEAMAKEKKAAYNGAIGGQSFDDWAEAVRRIDELPAAREIAEIETELETIRNGLAEGKTEAEKHQASIDHWMRAYADQTSLADKLLQVKADVKTVTDKLMTLATLPEEFDSPKTLLTKLDEAQKIQLQAHERLTEKKEKCAELTTRLADRRSEDVAEEGATAERRFQRAKAEGRAYLRIREEIDRITADPENDPLEEFGGKVAALFSRMTSGEATLEFDGQLPAHVVRGAVSLPPERLSHGGGGALALAVRLAMAEAYLAHGGFLMLDDPLVHFDAGRMAIAADILREFSQHAQVIFFTCHDHHAARLEGSLGE
ncbi:MAG: AAA family ATPase [Planctomycetia bacterium]|nr:AAA family ATPase [Planctomycetia bacterium]